MQSLTSLLIQKMTITLVVSVALLFGITSAVQAQNHLGDYHQSQGLECDACHTKNTETPPTPDTCLMCHDDYFDKTIELWPNPHANPHIQPTDEVICSDCHKGHSQQSVTCQTCHENFKFNVKSEY